MKRNVSKGKLGENIAAEFLVKRGYQILNRNWRYSRYGEIDIIASEKDTLVFIEVKARSTTEYGFPVEAVNKNKINKIRTLAGIYINENPELKYSNYRFDIIGIMLGKNPDIEHYKNVY